MVRPLSRSKHTHGQTSGLMSAHSKNDVLKKDPIGGPRTLASEERTKMRMTESVNGGYGQIKFLKVYTDNNLANPFTKALPKGKLTQHARSMGLRLASIWIRDV
ncbi:hypothetical protein Tco_1080070 [Tanacetum coccineum]|uniref:Uncharacterized protein n=1 Tax=Tanacetum coccineum TaxID=301880 RepID=A0ABQ5HTM5_9ASTR